MRRKFSELSGRKEFKDRRDKRGKQEGVVTIVPSDHYRLKSSLSKTRKEDQKDL